MRFNLYTTEQAEITIEKFPCFKGLTIINDQYRNDIYRTFHTYLIDIENITDLVKISNWNNEENPLGNNRDRTFGGIVIENDCIEIYDDYRE